MPIPIVDEIFPNGPFPLVSDQYVKTSARAVSWDAVATPNIVTFLNTTIAAAFRITGMLVRVYETNSGSFLDKTYDGATWVDYVPRNADYDVGISNGCVISNLSANIIQISAGSFTTLRGKRITVPVAVQKTLTTNGSFTFAWDDTLGDFAFLAHGVSGDTNDFPFALVSYDSGLGFLTKFVDISMANAGVPFAGEFLVGLLVGEPDSHFNDLYRAAAWMSFFVADGPNIPKRIRVIDDVTTATLTTLSGTVGITSPGGVVTGVGTRFKRDLAVGDLVRVNGFNAVISTLTSDTSMVLSAWGGGVQTAQAIARCDSASSYAEHIDLTAAPFSSNNLMFQSLTIVGSEWADPSDRPTLTWGNTAYAATKPLFNMTGTALRMAGIIFTYSGANEVGVNHNHCFVKGPGSRSVFTQIAVNAGGAGPRGLRNVFNFSSTFTATDDTTDLLLDQCSFGEMAGFTNVSYLYAPGAISGRVVVRGCSFASALGYDFVYEESLTTNGLRLEFDRCVFKDSRNGIAGVLGAASRVHFYRCEFAQSAVAYPVMPNDTFVATLTDCVFSSTNGVRLLGAALVQGGHTEGGCPLTGGTRLELANCDFLNNGSFSGTFRSISDSYILITATGTIGPSYYASQLNYIADTYLRKANLVGETNTMIAVTTSPVFQVTNVWCDYATPNNANTDPMILITSVNANIRFDHLVCSPDQQRESMAAVIQINADNGLYDFVNCQIDTQNGVFAVAKTVDGGSVGSINIWDCWIQSGGPVIQATTAASKLARVSIERCDIECSDTPVILPYALSKYYLRHNNIVIHSASDEAQTVAGSGAVNSYGECAHNSIYQDGGGAFLLQMGDFYVAHYTDNTIYNDNTSTTNGIGGIAHQGIVGEACVIANNDIQCDNNGATLADSLALISVGVGVNAPAFVSIQNNVLRSDGDGDGTARCRIYCRGTTTLRQAIVANNTLFAGSAGASGGPAIVEILVQTNGGGSTGSGQVHGNVLESDNGSSAGSQCDATIELEDVGAGSIIGNVIRTRGTGASSLASIQGQNVGSLTVIGNSITSQLDAEIIIPGTTVVAVMSGNVLYTPGGGTGTLTNSAANPLNTGANLNI